MLDPVLLESQIKFTWCWIQFSWCWIQSSWCWIQFFGVRSSFICIGSNFLWFWIKFFLSVGSSFPGVRSSVLGVGSSFLGIKSNYFLDYPVFSVLDPVFLVSDPVVLSVGSSGQSKPGYVTLFFFRTLTEAEKHAQEALFEVISSEASYLKSLNILISHFVQSPHLSGTASPRLISDSYVL